MDISEIITNPIVIGLVAGLITYIYMKWKNEKDKEGKEKKDKKKNTDVNLLIPASVFVVFWFISYAYFSSDEVSTKNSTLTKDADKINVKIRPVKSVELSSASNEPASFEVISKSNGVHIPNKLPDIFFEMV